MVPGVPGCIGAGAVWAQALRTSLEPGGASAQAVAGLRLVVIVVVVIVVLVVVLQLRG